jgi:hypothetical protein
VGVCVVSAVASPDNVEGGVVVDIGTVAASCVDANVAFVRFGNSAGGG